MAFTSAAFLWLIATIFPKLQQNILSVYLCLHVAATQNTLSFPMLYFSRIIFIQSNFKTSASLCLKFKADIFQLQTTWSVFFTAEPLSKPNENLVARF